MRVQRSDGQAEDLLLQLLQGSGPLYFSEIAAKRGEVNVEALRRAIWALVESGRLVFTDERRIELRPVER